MPLAYNRRVLELLLCAAVNFSAPFLSSPWGARLDEWNWNSFFLLSICVSSLCLYLPSVISFPNNQKRNKRKKKSNTQNPSSCDGHWRRKRWTGSKWYRNTWRKPECPLRLYQLMPQRRTLISPSLILQAEIWTTLVSWFDNGNWKGKLIEEDRKGIVQCRRAGDRRSRWHGRSAGRPPCRWCLWWRCRFPSSSSASLARNSSRLLSLPKIQFDEIIICPSGFTRETTSFDSEPKFCHVSRNCYLNELPSSKNETMNPRVRVQPCFYVVSML